MWYEDRFQMGSDRDPAVVVRVYATEAEARADRDYKSRPLDDPEVENWDGYFIDQVALSSLHEWKKLTADQVRELLAKITSD